MAFNATKYFKMNIYIFITLILWSVHCEAMSGNENFSTGNNERGETQQYQRMKNVTFDYQTMYLTYDEVIEFVDEIEVKYRNLVQKESIGTTHDGKDIILVKISNNFKDCKKATIVVGGIHGREWFTVSLALHSILKVLRDETLLKKSDWNIIPVANPDGYIYSHVKSRFWRKNRSTFSNGCVGVDINRNFDIHFGEDSFNNPCRDDYHGPNPNSEPETKAIAYAIEKVQGQVETFIALHQSSSSFGNYILYPHGYTKADPFDWIELERCGLNARDVLLRNNGPKVIVGNVAKIHDFAFGLAIDYAKDNLKVPFSYIVESHILTEQLTLQQLNDMFPIIETLSQCSSRYY